MMDSKYGQKGYLIQQDVMEDLAMEMRRGHHVSVRGPGGSGKTALLNYIQRENPFKFERITMLNGPELSFDASPLTAMLIGRERTLPELVLIDDFEDLVPEVVQDMVLQIIKEGRKYGKTVVLANRRHMNRKAFDTNTRHIHLRGFSETEQKDYLGKFFQTYGELKRHLTRLDKSGDSFASPLVLQTLSGLMQREGFSVDDFSKSILQDISYQNAPIIEALKK